MKKRLLSILLMCCMVLFLLPMTVFAGGGEETPAPEPIEWERSKSKTATQLDGNFESKVTLSLPSAQADLVSDVVLVLDKSTSAVLEDQALQMLSDLKEQCERTGAKVKAGVVIFNQKANVTGLLDLSSHYGEIADAIKQDIRSGTNTHAGLLAGKRLLDEDTAVEHSRKYLVFVSDGITYMFGEEPTAVSWSFDSDGTVATWAGPDNWLLKYGSNDAPADWDSWMQETGRQVQADHGAYDYPYGGTASVSTSVEEMENHAMSVDRALYETWVAYQEAEKTGYHCYAMPADTGAGRNYQWGTSFVSHLANDKKVDFSMISHDILYLLDTGSNVKDYIGFVKDDYDFDFVNHAEALEMKVNSQSIAVTALNETTYGFGEAVNGTYPYVLEYVEGNKQDTEHFVWTINVPVSNFAPVQLTYTVKLTNPKRAAGTYGVFDADGSENDGSAGYGLYTNSSASLYPVDSNGTAYAPEAFAKPTVSYTSTEPMPPAPNSGTEVASKPPHTPPADDSNNDIDVPQTGDSANMTLWIVLAGFSMLSLLAILLGKKYLFRDR